MKTFLTLLLCLSAALAHAQVADTVKLPIDPTTRRITYTGVVQVPGVSQAELYTRAKLWFADTFKSAKEVVQADEKDAGIVQGRGWAPISIHFIGARRPTTDFKLWQTIKIMVKDGRYRYEISSFEAELGSTTIPLEENLRRQESAGPKYAPVVAEYKEQVKAAELGLSASITAGMSKPATSTAAGKDW
jgi:hypothetical protein